MLIDPCRYVAQSCTQPFQPRENSSPTPTPQLWSFLFFILQALSVIPSFLGFFYCVHRFYSISPPMLINSSSTWLQGGKAVGVSEARSTRLDWFIAGMWALACAYFSHSLAKGLLRRWLVYYSLLPTVIRVISLQAICWPLCLTTHRVLSFDQPVAAWMICASTAAISVRLVLHSSTALLNLNVILECHSNLGD